MDFLEIFVEIQLLLCNNTVLHIQFTRFAAGMANIVGGTSTKGMEDDLKAPER